MSEKNIVHQSRRKDGGGSGLTCSLQLVVQLRTVGFELQSIPSRRRGDCKREEMI